MVSYNTCCDGAAKASIVFLQLGNTVLNHSHSMEHSVPRRRRFLSLPTPKPMETDTQRTDRKERDKNLRASVGTYGGIGTSKLEVITITYEVFFPFFFASGDVELKGRRSVIFSCRIPREKYFLPLDHTMEGHFLMAHECGDIFLSHAISTRSDLTE